MGFVAILGIIALSGMIIRNSVILIDQIDMDLARGLHPWDAVIDATTNRTRPILLTAAAASLGMIPIASEGFWGPMAYAIIGGLFVATLLTLLFLPALYVAWFRIKEPHKQPEPRLGSGCARCRQIGHNGKCRDCQAGGSARQHPGRFMALRSVQHPESGKSEYRCSDD